MTKVLYPFNSRHSWSHPSTESSTLLWAKLDSGSSEIDRKQLTESVSKKKCSLYTTRMHLQNRHAIKNNSANTSSLNRHAEISTSDDVFPLSWLWKRQHWAPLNISLHSILPTYLFLRHLYLVNHIKLFNNKAFERLPGVKAYLAVLHLKQIILNPFIPKKRQSHQVGVTAPSQNLIYPSPKLTKIASQIRPKLPKKRRFISFREAQISQKKSGMRKPGPSVWYMDLAWQVIEWYLHLSVPSWRISWWFLLPFPNTRSLVVSFISDKFHHISPQFENSLYRSGIILPYHLQIAWGSYSRVLDTSMISLFFVVPVAPVDTHNNKTSVNHPNRIY